VPGQSFPLSLPPSLSLYLDVEVGGWKGYSRCDGEGWKGWIYAFEKRGRWAILEW